MTHQKNQKNRSLIILRSPKINPRKKFTGSLFAKLNPQQNFNKVTAKIDPRKNFSRKGNFCMH